jgi:hypothetical protein
MAYYVKFRGKTLGPLEENQIHDMVRQGKLGRMSEISSDGQKWTRAGEIEAFFPKNVKPIRLPIPPQPPKMSAEYEKIADSGFTLVPPEIDSMNDAASQSAVWFYSEDGMTGFGPVSQSTLTQMFRQKKIHAKTIVWRDGGGQDATDPQPLEDVAELASLFYREEKSATAVSQKNAFTSKRSANVSASPQDDAIQNNALSPMILNPLERSGIWVFIFALGAIVAFALSIVLQLFLIVTLFRFCPSQTLTILTMIALLVTNGGIAYWIWNFWRYHFQLRQTSQQPTEANLSLTMNYLGNFWRISVILPISGFFLTLLFCVILFAAGINLKNVIADIATQFTATENQQVEPNLEPISAPKSPQENPAANPPAEETNNNENVDLEVDGNEQ